MRGYPHWPGRIDPPEKMSGQTMRKGSLCIFFFGSRNYAAVMPEDLRPYADFKEKFDLSCKRADLRRAMQEMDKFLAGTLKDEEDEDDDNKGSNLGDGHKAKTVKPERASAASSSEPSDDLAEAEFEAMVNGGVTPVSTPAKSKPSPEKKPQPEAGNNSKMTPPKKKFKIRSLASPLALPSKCAKRPATPEDEIELAAKMNSGAAASASASEPAKATTVISSPDSKKAKLTKARIGFLGLDDSGYLVAEKLIAANHKVSVWNKKNRKFEEGKVEVASSPAELVEKCDIVFCCIADPETIKEKALGAKSFVQLADIQASASEDLSESLKKRGGRYLEAIIHSGLAEPDNGARMVLAAGDKSLFDDCKACFMAIGKSSFYLGNSGRAFQMSLILQSVNGVLMAGMAEGLALGDRVGIAPNVVVEVLKRSGLNCGLPAQQRSRLDGLQKGLHLTVGLSNELDEPVPVIAAANEALKRVRKLGLEAPTASKKSKS